MSVLAREHSYFGPLFSDEGVVLSYANEGELELKSGAALSDLSGCAYLYIHGSSAAAFMKAAFAADTLEVGECLFSPAFLGDGAVASVALIMRTGDNEFVVMDCSARASVLHAWLHFVASIEDGGVRAYSELELDDASELLVPLLIYGNKDIPILSDYLSAGEKLPDEGSVSNILLDKILCVCARIPQTKLPYYLVLVSPDRAVSLFRSLLSFSEVEPHGVEKLRCELAHELAFFSHLSQTDRLEIPLESIASWQLMRPDFDFIGGRALSANL